MFLILACFVIRVSVVSGNKVKDCIVLLVDSGVLVTFSDPSRFIFVRIVF